MIKILISSLNMVLQLFVLHLLVYINVRYIDLMKYFSFFKNKRVRIEWQLQLVHLLKSQDKTKNKMRTIDKN